MKSTVRSKLKAIGIVIGTVALIVVFGLQSLISKGAAAQNETDPSKLLGIQMGPAPWVAEVENLLARLEAIHLPALTAEGNQLHIHQHLDLIINGAPVTVPADIGINYVARFISPLHTHDETGIIHVESDEVRDFTLGEFFDVWGVRFTKDCVGGYCAKGENALRVFADGKPVTGDPRRLVLQPHQEIAVIYGSQAPFKSVPSTYLFPPGT